MSVASFIPELWSARLLFNLEKNHVATNLVNREYEGQITQAGDTVHINSIGDITVGDYVKGTDIDVQDLDTTDQTLVIDQQKYFAFKVDDIDKVQGAGDLVDTAMGRASYSLADASDAYLLSTIADGADSANTIGTAASPITLTAENIYEKIVALRTKLDKANVPTTGRSIVIPPEAYALLLLDERFTKADAVAESTIVNGYVGKVAGFDVYESNNVKYTAVGTGASPKPENWSITAQVATATTYAEQIVSTEAFRPEKSFSDGVKGLHVYGAKVTQPKQIAKMLVNFTE